MRWPIAPALAALLASGCASMPFPEDALRGVDRSLSLGALRAAPAAHCGARVVLGGEVVAVMPRPGATEIEVLSRPLSDGGAPERGDRSDGRFLAHTKEFLDPAVYAPGRRITVLGTVTSTEERPIGFVPYTYVVITAERIKLWPRADPWIGNPSYPPLPLDAPVLPFPR